MVQPEKAKAVNARAGNPSRTKTHLAVKRNRRRTLLRRVEQLALNHSSPRKIAVPRSTNLLGGGHLEQVIRVCREVRRDDGTILSRDDRFFVTSMTTNRLTAVQWLCVVRSHWRVENDCHGTWDRILREDDHPWLFDARGMLAVILLRRVVGNMLALFRNVTRRGERKALVPWAEIIDWLRVALVAATDEHLDGLRWAPPRAGRAPPGYAT